MRRHVSSIVLSIGSPAIGLLAGPLRRYFMSQICCEIAATVAMSLPSDSGADYAFCLRSVQTLRNGDVTNRDERAADEAGHARSLVCGVFVFHRILSTIEV